MNTCTEERFLQDVADHQMTVLRDDGVFRHLRFRQHDTICMSFDLITWPGYLCYCGDMGTYVFSRLEDMFEFFRSRDGQLRINLSYWAEKVKAQDVRGPIEEYSPDTFRACIQEWLDDHDATDEVREEVEDRVLAHAEDGEDMARRAADEFEHDKFRFADFFEADLMEYTFRYTWCCFAVVWGIKQYDKAQEAAA